MSTDKRWMLEMTAAPIVPAWTIDAPCNTNGAELQRAIIKGLSNEGDPIWSSNHKEFRFEKTLTFKEHGEFLRGALTMASLRYTPNDFYELLQRYGTIKVMIVKSLREDK